MKWYAQPTMSCFLLSIQCRPISTSRPFSVKSHSSGNSPTLISYIGEVFSMELRLLKARLLIQMEWFCWSARWTLKHSHRRKWNEVFFHFKAHFHPINFARLCFCYKTVPLLSARFWLAALSLGRFAQSIGRADTSAAFTQLINGDFVTSESEHEY